MPDIIANGEFGRDDGITCDDCGGNTFLIDDQGYGLCSYQCEVCDNSFSVQFESSDEDEEYEPEGWEVALFEERTSPV